MSWDTQHLPSEAGRTFVVTGGNAGVGYFTSEQLASTGARVILASRSAEKAERAMASIRERIPGAELGFVRLDLTSLSAVAAAAEQLRGLGPLDGLINNAGLVAGPRRRTTTEDGLEIVIGSNLFGPFALTAQLWPALTATGRVVSVGSMSTRLVRLDAGDLLSERRYRPFRAYGLSKHAVQGFALELDRRIRAAGERRLSLLAHPGFAADGLAERRPGINDLPPLRRLAERSLGLVGQGKDHGAWPSVRALLDPDAAGGQFYGPSRQLTGPPIVIAPVAASATPEFGAQLWALAEERTGVTFTV